MANTNYSEEEKTALRGIFSLFDQDDSGYIPVSDLGNVLAKIGKDPAEASEMLNDAGLNGAGRISFDEFLTMLQKRDQDGPPGEGPDAKVMEFLRILDEYRLKCEEEGNYLEAGRAAKQLETLKKQEERRQSKALKARQIAERQDVQIAHNMQYAEFNQAWDRYLEEYDQMAQMYIQQMTERHAVMLREFQENLHKQLMSKPPKFSKELLDWRRRQHMLAKQKQYAEAQKIKRIADVMEERERKKMEGEQRALFERKEAKIRSQQSSELAALLKRIDGRRKEHIKQRNLDSKRLLQRNRNVQAVLESKQAVESQRRLQDIKNELSLGANSRTRQSGGGDRRRESGGRGGTTFLTQG